MKRDGENDSGRFLQVRRLGRFQTLYQWEQNKLRMEKVCVCLRKREREIERGREIEWEWERDRGGEGARERVGERERVSEREKEREWEITKSANNSIINQNTQLHVSISHMWVCYLFIHLSIYMSI